MELIWWMNTPFKEWLKLNFLMNNVQLKKFTFFIMMFGKENAQVLFSDYI